MATRTKTIRLPFTTRTTNLATNTTLGTATRLDFASITARIPETTRSIKYAEIQIGARDVFTTAADFDGVRVGVKINAVAFGDTDYTLTPANTGDHTRVEVRRNATSYMNTNDPGTSTFTLQIGCAFATSAASNVIGVTGIVLITYEYDDTASTQVKTVAIPIQSHHTLHSTAYVEVGTTGGTSNAPANQIPQLTGAGSPFLPESTITIDHYWLDVYGLDLTTTTHTYTYRVDGATDCARFACDQTLASTVDYFDRFDLSTAGAAGAALSTTAAHAFEVKVDVANKAESFGAILWVTYRFDATSGTHLVSLQLPLQNGHLSGQTMFQDSTSTDAERLQAVLDVQEAATITMKQSGAVLHSMMNVVTRNILASGQTARAYTVASDVTRCTGPTLIHRGDHSSSTWTLARGVNRLTLDVYAGSESLNTVHTGGYAIVNYHCVINPAGPGVHNRTCVWGVTDYVEIAATTRTNIAPTAPIIAESTYSLQGVVTDSHTWIATANKYVLAAERASGEGAGAGWQSVHVTEGVNSAAELGVKRSAYDVTDWWRKGGSYADPERLNIETTRSWQAWSHVAMQGQHSLWVTYHTCQFDLSGLVEKNGAAVADGGTVVVFADNGSGLYSERVANTVTASGAWHVFVTDSTRTYYAVYKDGTDFAGFSGPADDDVFAMVVPGSASGGYSHAQIVN